MARSRRRGECVSIFTTYGGYSENLATSGGERALCIQVRQIVPQRPVHLTASCLFPGATDQFARVIVYAGEVKDVENDPRTLDSNGLAINEFGFTRILANVTFGLNIEPLQINFPPLPVPLFCSEPNGYLGAILLLPHTNASFVSQNGYGALTFWGAPIDDDTISKYKVV
jgi:hypothetical protein